MAERSPERQRPRRHVREVVGLALGVLAAVTLLALLSYDAADPSWFTRRPAAGATRNWFGPSGTLVAELLLQLFGTAAFLAPLALGAAAWRIARRPQARIGPARLAGSAVLAAALVALLDLFYGWIAYGGDLFRAGGYLGARVAGGLRALGHVPGAVVVALTALVASLVLLTRVSLVGWTSRLGLGAAALGRVAGRRMAGATRALPGWMRRLGRPRESTAMPEIPARAAPAPPRAAPAPSPPAPAERPTIRLEPAAPAEPPTAGDARRPPEPPRPRRRIEPAALQASLPLDPGARGYSLPPLELLAEPEPQAIESEQELLERARQITEKLREFAVHGSVVAIHPGPVVTTFEFKPEAGVKYSKITGMTDDLSLALKAESVRIDRMAGRATVGIEVPNRRQETIYPRELFGSDAFQGADSRLTLALGKDISGHPFLAKLDRMPHLLIAGATGSGKSVALNGMIASVLYKATPDQVRMIMIDTKMIELGVYADIPHLLVPVVTEPKQASAALKWACREMEERYRKLAAVGVRNIAQFNELLVREPGRTMDDPRGGEPLALAPLPYIVIVIDELADLMIVSSADVEESIMRLAQMARAVGLHLIVATQRPSVDVITGTIKANFPSRIAFRVSQRVDSRTIIDQQGAEHLLGRGDMLFLSSGSSRLRRLHGGLITEAELARLTTYVKKHARPDYDESVLREADDEAQAIDEAERDEMYLRAVRTVIDDGKCSITLIQRRLQLGYARAARIVDMMEREGVVSPGEGSKPRDVLVGPDYLDSGDGARP